MAPPSHFPFLLLVLFFMSPPKLLLLRSPRPCSALSPDGLTLLAFKSSVSADPSSTLAEWDEEDDDPCRWPGVSCANVSGYPYPRVVALSVADKNLSGYIPSELGTLVFLRRLNLHGNLLSGPIPPQLSNATSLHSLFLYANNLSGPVPPSLCNLPRLQNLDLSRNALFGPIPAELRNCHQLQRLLLSSNRLSGEVPTGIWPELGQIVQLDLSSNNLSGGIPPDLGDLKLLSGTLNLSHNQFSGEIPSNLGNLPPTVSLDLRGNNLSGEIPQVGSLSNQGPAAFQGNPNLCGFPLLNPCQGASPGASGRQNNPTGSPVAGGGKRAKKGLSLGMIILIAVADAVGVALIGLVLVYAYWKLKDGDRGCSCTGKTKLGGDGGGKPWLCCWKRASCGGAASSCSEEGDQSSDGGGGGGSADEGEGDLVAIDKGFAFELDELLRASAYVLGKSGLGIVYKVVLGNGVPVAVRRLGEGGAQRHKEFAAEAQAIGRVRHPNVVRLRAYYWAPDEKLLISDFISNGSLAAALRVLRPPTTAGDLSRCNATVSGLDRELLFSRRSGQPVLSWSTRLRIARGTARGLAYIHECSPRKFVHGDVKPSNILLDADFNPQISDFGLLRLANIAGGADAASAGLIGGGLLLPNTAAAKSTPPPPDRPNSYRAPEARVDPGSRPAQKWDVYSFGVVLLELLTGKPPAKPSPPSPAAPTFSPSSAGAGMDAGELVRWVRKGFQDERPLTELLDPALLREVQAKKEVVAAFHVALACTETDPELRPKMKAVADNLDKIGS
ncbi:hypothetical protein Taro_042612 [Colocasia esculenta]|uniref:non-specific serine/threonine protein kinase n=1 Tax=Colocasia esculenta TaxID=4460 RepID=A0A843WQ14_COLES|nr:hypothetical protein [Colocasia esculenta]